jgi:hypothetical protein
LLHRCAAQPLETHEASVHLEYVGHGYPHVAQPLFVQEPYSRQDRLQALRVDCQ